MASKRGQRRKACEGKVRHETKDAAASALRKNFGRSSMHTYKCPHCGGFHVGHKMQKKRTRRREFTEV